MEVGQQHDGERIANVVLLALAVGLGLAGCHDRGPSPVQAEHPTQPGKTAPEPELSSRRSAAEFDWRREYEVDPSAGVFAIVPRGAKLRRSPRPDAPSWTYDGVRSGVVRVLGETDDAVEIELGWQPSDASMHCVSDSFSDLGLRLFIDRGELEDVTSVGQTIELGPDTGINVAPGVLVDRDAGLLMVRSSYGGDLRVDVDPERLRVDKFYVPARADSAPVALEQEVAGVVTYEDHDLCFWRQSLYASAPGDPPRALVGAECIQVAGVAWLNPEATGCDRSSGGGGPSCSQARYGDAWTIPAGTELSWPEGGPAGRVHGDFVVHEQPDRDGRRACFDPELSCGGIELFRVCVDADALVHSRIEKPTLERHSG